MLVYKTTAYQRERSGKRERKKGRSERQDKKKYHFIGAKGTGGQYLKLELFIWKLISFMAVNFGEKSRVVIDLNAR